MEGVFVILFFNWKNWNWKKSFVSILNFLQFTTEDDEVGYRGTQHPLRGGRPLLSPMDLPEYHAIVISKLHYNASCIPTHASLHKVEKSDMIMVVLVKSQSND